MLYRIHAWTGLITGILILIISVTGSIVVFKPEIERMVEPGMRETHRIDPDAPRLSVDEVVARFHADHPGSQVTAIRLPNVPGSHWSHGPAMSLLVKVSSETKAAAGTWDVVVDPTTGQELGRRRQAESWGQWLRDFHVRLFYGYWGRVFIGAFGLVMALSTITGLVIFTRFNKNSWVPRIRWGRGPRIVIADWHKTIGMTTLLLSLIFAATGAVLGLENLYHRYFKEEAAEQASQRPERTAPDAPGILEASIARALQEIPATAVASQMTLPREDRPIVTVHVEHPTLSLIREHTSYVTFNSMTGDVIEVYNAAHSGVAARLYYASEPLHFGRFGGSMTLKVLYAATGILIGFLSISGYIIYAARKWKKWFAPAPGMAPIAPRAKAVSTTQATEGAEASPV